MFAEIQEDTYSVRDLGQVGSAPARTIRIDVTVSMLDGKPEVYGGDLSADIAASEEDQLKVYQHLVGRMRQKDRHRLGDEFFDRIEKSIEEIFS